MRLQTRQRIHRGGIQMSIETTVDAMATCFPARRALPPATIRCPDCGDALTWHSDHICQCIRCHKRRTRSNCVKGVDVLEHAIALASRSKTSGASTLPSDGDLF